MKFLLRYALFWVITQKVVVIPCRRLGSTHPSHLRWSRIKNKNSLPLLDCALLGHYAASSGNSLQTFHDNLSVILQGSRIFILDPRRCNR
jgi:hypothetical protein